MIFRSSLEIIISSKNGCNKDSVPSKWSLKRLFHAGSVDPKNSPMLSANEEFLSEWRGSVNAFSSINFKCSLKIGKVRETNYGNP